MSAGRAWLIVALLLWHACAEAGAACDDRQIGPQQMAAAAANALAIRDALEAENAPVALVARAGTDLSRYGLRYSHAGLAFRDHPNGRWTVVHLLNTCGSQRSQLHADGLMNFYADNLAPGSARVVWLDPGLAQQLATWTDSDLQRLHETRYNLIARPGSGVYQNSTAWLLEVLAAAQLRQPQPSRSQAQALLTAQAFLPDHIHISYGKRIAGGLFSANTVFTDHPLATRLSGDYPVVTVRSIIGYLAAQGLSQREREWLAGTPVKAQDW